MRNWIRLLAALSCLLVAWPAAAGHSYRSITKTTGYNQKTETMEANVLVDGDDARVTFVSREKNRRADLFCDGCYLLVRKAGEENYLVNPHEGTYSEWDLDKMFAALGQLTESGMLNLEFSDPRVEKLLEESGGDLLGYPTTHYRWLSTYRMRFGVMGIDRTNEMEILQDVWVTTAVSDAAMRAWLNFEPPKTGDEGFDKMLAAEAKKINGFALKSVTVMKSTGQKGKTRTTTSDQNVINLKREDVAASVFELDPGLERRPILATGMDGAQAEDDEGKGGALSGLKVFGRKKKKN